jgi:hypothetical protein
VSGVACEQSFSVCEAVVEAIYAVCVRIVIIKPMSMFEISLVCNSPGVVSLISILIVFLIL